MKRCAWMLGMAGILKLLTGCATQAAAPERPAALSPAIETGFLNKSLDNGALMKRYVVYVPYGYTPEKAWPMIMFLHGAGERGRDGLLQTEVGLGAAIRRHADRWPAIVVMPQCPENMFYDALFDDIERAMNRTFEEYNIDRKRVYLTGLSMGGYGTWIWGALKTDTFAALMPICGGGEIMDIKMKIGASGGKETYGTLDERVKKLAQVPIWAFHGADDDVVSPERSRKMVKLVKAAGGDVQYTEFPKTGHNSWDQAYNLEKAIDWLFAQHLK